MEEIGSSAQHMLLELMAYWISWFNAMSIGFMTLLCYLKS